MASRVRYVLEDMEHVDGLREVLRSTQEARDSGKDLAQDWNARLLSGHSSWIPWPTRKVVENAQKVPPPNIRLDEFVAAAERGDAVQKEPQARPAILVADFSALGWLAVLVLIIDKGRLEAAEEIMQSPENAMVEVHRKKIDPRQVTAAAAAAIAKREAA